MNLCVYMSHRSAIGILCAYYCSSSRVFPKPTGTAALIHNYAAKRAE